MNCGITVKYACDPYSFKRHEQTFNIMFKPPNVISFITLTLLTLSLDPHKNSYKIFSIFLLICGGTTNNEAGKTN